MQTSVASASATQPHRPALSQAGLKPSHAVVAVDEFGQPREGHIAGEQPLTLYLDKREVVTLMTLGTHPELLVLGYPRNQRLVPSLESVRSVKVDLETDACAVTTFDGVGDLDKSSSIAPSPAAAVRAPSSAGSATGSIRCACRRLRCISHASTHCSTP